MLKTVLALAFASLPLFACAVSSSESTESSGAASVTDILTMTRRSDGRFDVVCADNARETVTADDIRADRVCRGGASDAGTGQRLGVIYGRSDSCEAAQAILTVKDTTDCLTLSATQEAWSVSVGGRCNNIQDTNVRAACLSIKPRGTLVYGRSDSCEADKALMWITQDTDCLSLSATQEVWSTSIDGRCTNVQDTNLRAACIELQN